MPPPQKKPLNMIFKKQKKNKQQGISQPSVLEISNKVNMEDKTLSKSWPGALERKTKILPLGKNNIPQLGLSL